uniref:Uncharacterized protein n=1 Tax=Neobodo designis TaxID=312471 RepID=A0A7S1MKS4_NEODS|mmetsp:Transcript_4225/g.13503  ORF Transcript_4225/g.13503 Transcript_4225/m.13503 type:complete len:415 (+) Transcript_4225:28-1272(+)
MNFVKNLMSRAKTKRSPLDVSDFVAKRPQPSVTEIWEKVDTHFAGNPAERAALELHKARMFFDVRYRCGAGGRCLEGDYRCRFPACFNMRPCFKGGEIFMERYGMTQKIEPRNKDLVRLVEAEKLDEALTLIDSRIAEYRGRVENVSKMTPRALEEWSDLVFYKATLLMNVGRDADAVALMLAAGREPDLPRREQVEFFSMATNFAVLNDMETRFYRHHVSLFPDLAGAKEKAERDEILNLVVDAVKHDDELEDHVVHAVLGKEVTGVVARAQNSQDYDDDAEDPIGTPVIQDSLVYYKEVIGGRFWMKFHHLAMAPPIDPEADGAAPPGESEETPRHVLDALGRSMILHHTAKLLSEGQLEDDGVKTMTKEKLAAMPKQLRMTLKRMQELLEVVRDHGQPRKKGKLVPNLKEK